MSVKRNNGDLMPSSRSRPSVRWLLVLSLLLFTSHLPVITCLIREGRKLLTQILLIRKLVQVKSRLRCSHTGTFTRIEDGDCIYRTAWCFQGGEITGVGVEWGVKD